MSDIFSLANLTGSDLDTGSDSTDFPTTNTDASDLFGDIGNTDSDVSYYTPGIDTGIANTISSPTPTSFLGGFSSDLSRLPRWPGTIGHHSV